MADVPSEVRLGPHTVTVRSDPDTVGLLREDGRRADTLPNVLTIRIDPDRPPTAVAESLLHEILHACWDLTSLRTSEQCAEIEEAAVSALSPWLLGVLRDNPDLVKLLTKGA